MWSYCTQKHDKHGIYRSFNLVRTARFLWNHQVREFWHKIWDIIQLVEKVYRIDTWTTTRTELPLSYLMLILKSLTVRIIWVRVSLHSILYYQGQELQPVVYPWIKESLSKYLSRSQIFNTSLFSADLALK